MNITIDTILLEYGECLEPEVGAEWLLFYPGLLSAAERQIFEQHLTACDYCREMRKFWHLTGIHVGVDTVLKQAEDDLRNRRYESAIARYNRIARFVPNIGESEAGQALWSLARWHRLTAAKTPTRNLLAMIFPSHALGSYAMAAAANETAFPIFVEYADGQVKGKISASGTFLFFELLELSEEFRRGVFLVGRYLDPPIPMYLWKITPGQKHRLGTILSVFGGAEVEKISNALRTFNVFPIYAEDVQ